MISNPYLPPEDNRTKKTIIQQIRKFASRFKFDHSAIWSWHNNGSDEVNCHTFLFLLLGELKVADPIIAKKEDYHFIAYFYYLKEDSKIANQKRIQSLTDLQELSSRLPPKILINDNR